MLRDCFCHNLFCVRACVRVCVRVCVCVCPIFNLFVSYFSLFSLKEIALFEKNVYPKINLLKRHRLSPINGFSFFKFFLFLLKMTLILLDIMSYHPYLEEQNKIKYIILGSPLSWTKCITQDKLLTST